jgi:hypothetical protein
VAVGQPTVSVALPKSGRRKVLLSGALGIAFALRASDLFAQLIPGVVPDERSAPHTLQHGGNVNTDGVQAGARATTTGRTQQSGNGQGQNGTQGNDGGSAAATEENAQQDVFRSGLVPTYARPLQGTWERVALPVPRIAR